MCNQVLVKFLAQGKKNNYKLLIKEVVVVDVVVDVVNGEGGDIGKGADMASIFIFTV